MSDPVAGGPAPRTRQHGPAASRQKAEWASFALLLGAAANLAYHHDYLAPWMQAAGWTLLALALAYLLRRGWVRLFGPVLFYDLIRNARRARTYVTRSAYLGLLLLALWAVVGSQLDRHQYRGPDLSSKERAELAAREMARLAESFFYTFLSVQFALAVLLTPAYVAPAIAEEKERKTLEYLLATDLDGREIVLDKLLARLGYLTLLLMTGVPVLSAVQFLGGVEPALVFAGFVGTALTVAGLAGVSVLASVYARRSRDAIVLTYLVLGLYVLLCPVGDFVVGILVMPRATLFPGGPSPADCVAAFQVGNPYYAMNRLFSAPTGSVREALPEVLPAYAAFYAILTASTVSLAVLRMRAVALREAGGAKAGGRVRRDLRAVSDPPMVWKETYYSSRFRLPWWGKVTMVLLVALSFGPFFIIGAKYSGGSSFNRSTLADEVNGYVRVVGTVVACCVLLAAALRGATAVRIEKDKDTLDALLTSPLSTQDILFGKWIGCLWGLRWPCLWLGGIYLAGLVSGGLSPLAVPLLACVMLVYCGTLSAVGLWFSVICRTTVRATVATLFAAAGLGVGHWMLWLCCVPFGPGRDLETVFKLQAGMTPPFVLGFVLPFSSEMHYLGPDHSAEGEVAGYVLLGTLVWAALGGVVWAMVNDRFQQLNNRRDILEPERPRMAPAVRKPPTEHPADGWGPFEKEAT
jgi:ABC-type transport system involved in multi-copper enzyme maturation permease subunit